MASDIPGSKPPGWRPPTIDLKATEVASEQTASGPSQASSAASAEARAGGSASQGKAGGPPNGPGLWFRLMDHLPPDPKWPLIGAGLGAIAVILLVGLWWSGMFIAPVADSNSAARLDRIESQLRDLANRPAPAAVTDTKALSDVAARLSKIEAALAAQGTVSTDAAAKATQDEIAALRGRLDEIATLSRGAQSRADAAASAADAAQKASQSTTAELARVAASDDRASRRAVAANALRAAVERGEPFATELAAAKPLAADPSLLVSLEPFAASGVTPATILARDLTALVPAMLRASSTVPQDAGFLDKLQANAERLVRIRPVGSAAGDDAASVIARVENKATLGDIDAALAEMMKLPPSVRAPAEAWIKTAEQRRAAINASRQFARDALAALGKPGL
jgi:hypothetical protein